MKMCYDITYLSMVMAARVQDDSFCQPQKNSFSLGDAWSLVSKNVGLRRSEEKSEIFIICIRTIIFTKTHDRYSGVDTNKIT